MACFESDVNETGITPSVYQKIRKVLLYAFLFFVGYMFGVLRQSKKFSGLSIFFVQEFYC